MKTFVCPIERVAARRLLICFVLVHVLTMIECLPLSGTAAVPSALSSSSPLGEDLLRLFNVSNEDVEASRQKQLAIRHSSSVNHHNFPANSRQQQHHHQQHSSSHAAHPEVAVPASAYDAQISIIHQRNRSALQRKQEVFRNVLGFVNLNGRPQIPAIPGGTLPGAPPIPPFFSPFQRPEATVDLYERTRYLQPSCDGPKHADEEIWSSGSSSPLSFHLFFNLSGIQSQTRNGFQLFVTGAKLRLLKFVEGEAFPSVNLGPEKADTSSGFVGLEQPLQMLKAVPFFDTPLQPSDEEKIRVSVHNYTRALKRNRVQKKKLLDSQMAMAKEENFMKLDIKLAARWWLAPGGRNFGLAIEVEDTDGQRKPVTRFFRPRNCSSEIEGSIRSDEILDPTNVVSPVLELTVIEMPEGRSVFEIPSSVIKGRFEETESVGSEYIDTLSEIMEEPTLRKHRHQHSSRIIHTSQEEQADEAVFRINNKTLKSDFASSPTTVGKHRISHRTSNQTPNHRPTLSPVPTLATLEDHDLLREIEEEETIWPEVDESRNLLRSTSIFLQRMMQQPPQQHNSKMTHFSRTKDNRKQ
ncbi:uncharacterized protein LOC124343460 isoform X2 [Daphnia pulicaria]|uniref:uncharacterized protein LOC124343460 isoform X2 n=1 Tax=Daphnia pulicaria TaxID=35523 RepID=UPI001EEAA147|nr:uncharacterized protein LOC124343460 isoform X2 [Daphnia pulicaria]